MISIGKIGMIVIIGAIMYCSSFAQTSSQQSTINSMVYEVPFASNGNCIELTVVNISKEDITNIKVETANLPDWLRITPNKQEILKLRANEEKQVQFSFSVDKSAPIKKEQIIPFTIKSPNGERWSKFISILITPPEKFELFQNYPNPFNPLTFINYQMPTNTFVTLKLYNVLSQEITTLINEYQEAGYKSVTFDASSLPSGVYYYRMQAGKFTDTKKMMLIR